jgi:hypothetical protein
MGGVIDIAKQLNLPETVLSKIMGDIKKYMTSLMEKIFVEIGMSFEDATKAATSMAYAYGGLSHEEYMKLVSGAFSGAGGSAALAPVEDFINTQFKIPDLGNVKNDIYTKVTAFVTKYGSASVKEGGLGLEP